MFESAPCDQRNEDGGTSEDQARDKEVERDHLISNRMKDLMKKHEEGQRGNIEPEPLRTDGGKAQEDLTEEGQNEREGQKIEGEIDQKE